MLPLHDDWRLNNHGLPKNPCHGQVYMNSLGIMCRYSAVTKCWFNIENEIQDSRVVKDCSDECDGEQSE